MAEEPDPPPGRHHRGQAGVQLDRSMGVQEAQAVGAHQPCSPATGQPHEALLAPDAFRTRFRKPGREHQEAAGALVQGPLGEGVHLGGGNGQDHQIRGFRQGCQGRIGLHAFDGLGPGIDWINSPLEASLEDVAENDAPHGGGIAGGAHHGHRPGPRSGTRELAVATRSRMSARSRWASGALRGKRTWMMPPSMARVVSKPESWKTLAIFLFS